MRKRNSGVVERSLEEPYIHGGFMICFVVIFIYENGTKFASNENDEKRTRRILALSVIFRSVTPGLPTIVTRAKEIRANYYIKKNETYIVFLAAAWTLALGIPRKTICRNFILVLVYYHSVRLPHLMTKRQRWLANGKCNICRFLLIGRL